MKKGRKKKLDLDKEVLDEKEVYIDEVDQDDEEIASIVESEIKGKLNIDEVPSRYKKFY